MAANDATWADPENWTSFHGHKMIYSAADDDRILVPKQPVTVLGTEVPLGLYPIVTSWYSSTTLYHVYYHIQELFFTSDNRI
jgi:hypothetical protein